MRVNETANEIEITYDSVNELAAIGFKHLTANLDAEFDGKLKQRFHAVSSRDELTKLAAEGWIKEADTALDIATAAVETVEREHEMTGFHPYWDVSGCEVDVARYLAREPECMIDYEIVPTTRAGRVIVLCASVCYSSAVSTESAKKRGHAIAALAFALSKLGYQTELWADMSHQDTGRRTTGRYRVLVKGANDELDPAQIMFAFSHPAMFRALGISAMREIPNRFHRPLGIGRGHGYPIDPKQDLPEGTIYLPSIKSSYDVPEAKDMLLKYLRELGIVED